MTPCGSRAAICFDAGLSPRSIASVMRAARNGNVPPPWAKMNLRSGQRVMVPLTKRLAMHRVVSVPYPISAGATSGTTAPQHAGLIEWKKDRQLAAIDLVEHRREGRV